VRRSGKSFAESWSPASVLKVIGATKFLVQYMHIGSDGELATEIIAAQYTRPAQTFRKYRFSQSFHVEVMHEHSWWPGVLLNVLGSGINKKYVVKLKSYETDMEDVECLDVLTVEKTHVRPKFHWNGKKWVRCLDQVYIFFSIKDAFITFISNYIQPLHNQDAHSRLCCLRFENDKNKN
jgi:hypothetical protein